MSGVDDGICFMRARESKHWAQRRCRENVSTAEAAIGG